MSIEEVVIKKDKRSKTHHGEPRNPVMVLKIVYGRDKLKMTWQALGDKFTITRAGARHLYFRWRDWYYSVKRKKPSKNNDLGPAV